MNKIKLPETVRKIINTITAAGYEAYAVGGCIRDMLLGKEPKDYDITTSAKPEEVKALFRRTIDTGIEHGTVTIMVKETGYEVTTYRIDGKYEDSRHPSEVKFTRSLKEDLLRRDFTINAMAYNDQDGLQDPFDGVSDLEKGIIRCVGDPMMRFGEDALRIMRAVRFSAQLGYEIETKTFEAMKALSGTLEKISKERIQAELEKLLCSDHPGNIRIAYETGITKVIMPEFDEMMQCEQNNPHHCYSVGEHTVHVVENIENDRYLRLGALFHDIGKPECKKTGEDGIDHFHGHPEVSRMMARNILRRLKFDNNTIKIVSELAGFHDLYVDPTLKGVRKAMNKTGEDLFPMVLKIKYADIMAQSDFKREEKLDKLKILNELYEEIIKNKDCITVKDLAITGHDLIKMGVPEGPRIRQILQKVLDEVIDDPSLNNRDSLIELVKDRRLI
ncbi:MAG: CCA tRNA nucleotidyltransferase [Lachnospiraceae bacterium]|nr:CCA tRNA nucleotidyltransferase [Lachnospiraceae bacterium]